MTTYWLIEHPKPASRGQGVGFVKAIDRDGTYDVYFTEDANKALKFPDEYSANMIIQDTGFLHAFGENHKFYVASHVWVDEPDAAMQEGNSYD